MLRSDRSWWELGRGSSGVTYRALDIDSLQPVALKVLGAAGTPMRVAPAFVFQQAMEIAKLRHANVARLVHCGSGEDGRCFLVSELAEGETLAQLIDRAGLPPHSVALEVAGQIVRSLEAAGELGIRHRDLRPEKIMVGKIKIEAESRLTVKVMGFGLIDCLQPAGPSDRAFRGTSGFASPEQSAGRATDSRADFYGFGATMYFLFSGRMPDAVSFPPKATDPRPAPRVHFTPLRERGVPEEIIAWLRRLLDPNPAGRPRDAIELVESLASLRARLRNVKNAPVPPARGETKRWWNRWFG